MNPETEVKIIQSIYDKLHYSQFSQSPIDNLLLADDNSFIVLNLPGCL